MFDSGVNNGVQVGEALAYQLSRLHQALFKTPPAIKLYEAKDIPKQINNYDCGVYCIGFCEYILL